MHCTNQAGNLLFGQTSNDPFTLLAITSVRRRVVMIDS
jgi:hypothetical protein